MDITLWRKRLRDTAKNALALFLGVIAAYGIWRVSEKVCHTLNEREDRRVTYEGDYYTSFFQYDAVVGPKPAPNVRVRAVKKRNDALVYDVTYTTDQLGRRISYAAAPDPRDAFLVFFGCSFTFGEGLNDDETLPWRAALNAPSYHVYNYGCPGYGPQQMLAKSECGAWPREITEKRGIVVYVFVADHVRRAIGSMRVATKWGRTFPNYWVDASNNLLRNGDFSSGRPTLMRWYRSIMNIDTVRYAGLDLPIFVNDAHLDFTALLVRHAKDCILRDFPNARFCVAIYPEGKRSELQDDKFEQRLAEHDIACYDLRALLNMDDSRYTIPGDGHPTAAANEIVANELVKSLHLAEPPPTTNP